MKIPLERDTAIAAAMSTMRRLSLHHGRLVHCTDMDAYEVEPGIIRLVFTTDVDVTFHVDVDVTQILALREADCGRAH